MNPFLILAIALSLSVSSAAERAQGSAVALSPAAFAELAGRCASGAPLDTLRSIVTVESAFNPFALSINYPEAAGVQLGLGEGTVTLSRQPATLEEAVRWARWFVANGQTVSVGLMQLNVEHLAAFKMSLERAFDPCTNLKLGWAIFNDKYAQASAMLGKGQLAMHAAYSAYNSGNLIGGFRNGYVEAILRNQYREAEVVEPPPDYAESLPPVQQSAPNTDKQESGKVLLQIDNTTLKSEPPPNPRTTETKVGWDMKRATGPWVRQDWR